MTAVFALNSVGFGSSSDFSRAIAAGWADCGLYWMLPGSDRGADTQADTGGRAGTLGTVVLPTNESLNSYL